MDSLHYITHNVKWPSHVVKNVLVARFVIIRKLINAAVLHVKYNLAQYRDRKQTIY